MSLPDRIRNLLDQKPKEVTAMVGRVNTALYERATFERSKKPHGSHVELRRVANMYADSRNMAAFLHVIGADPQVMFNKVRKDGTRANLKGLQKVRKLCDFILEDKPLDMPSKALFAATIIANRMGAKWISSNEQEFILSSESVESLPADIRNAIYAYQHKHMTIEGDSRPQSCTFRTTYANLGAYHYAREEFDNSEYSLGIMVDTTSPIIQHLTATWELERFKS